MITKEGIEKETDVVKSPVVVVESEVARLSFTPNDTWRKQFELPGKQG